jgi:hypothetical protein
MRLDGNVLKDKKESEKHKITGRAQKGIERHTKGLLPGQYIDWKKNDWRDYAMYVPSVIGNPYYPRMMSLVTPEYPPKGWEQHGFDDSNWMVFWNTSIRGKEGEGSVYTQNLFMRTYFIVPDPSKAKDMILNVIFRGGIRVFVNGQEVGRAHLPKGDLPYSIHGEAYPSEAYYNKREESADRKSQTAIGEIWTRFIKGGRSEDPKLKRYRCPAPPQWNGYKGPWLNRTGWDRLKNMRDRKLENIIIPAKFLKKGSNVLALEIRGSLYHPMIFSSDKWRRASGFTWGASKSWEHCRLIKLRVYDPSETLPIAFKPPETFHVWVEDMHTRLYTMEYRPAAMPVGKVNIVGALNGTYSGQISVFSGKEIKGIKAEATDLKHAQKEAVIPSKQIRITGMVGQPITKMYELGVHIKGLDKGPRTFMAVDILNHVLKSPFYTKVREKPRDWWEKTASKILFYDHIGSGMPASIPPNTIQPLWVRMDVPMKTEPGIYKGSITISAQGIDPVAVPIEAEIIGWRVPSAHEFITDMGLVHHPYAIANQYLLPKDAVAKPRERDWLGPVKAKIPLWSDKHYELLKNSFKLMARVGNDLLFIPVLHRTEFGNYEDSMVKWIRKKDGTYTFDFTNMDKFIDLALQYMGKPRVICFVIMHCQMSSPVPTVTVFDEASGEYENLTLGWKDDAFKRLPIWKQFGAAVLTHMRKKGLEQSVYWGHGGDHESDPALMGFFWELFPTNYWAASGHTYHGGAGGGGHSRNVVRYFADVYGAASPVESKLGWKGGYIGGGPSVLIGTQYAASSHGKAGRLVKNDTYLYVHCPRDELRGAAQPIRWRGITSISLHRGYCGVGHVGLDSYQQNYLDGYIGTDWAFPGRPHHSFTWPGPDGAETSARYETFIEGTQESEARIFLEQTIDRGLLSEEMAKQAKDVTVDYINNYCVWPQLRSDSVYDYIHRWQTDSRTLLTMAAKVANIVGVDIDQMALRTRVAALGETHRSLRIRNWTDKPRAWEAKTDKEWIKLKETKGELFGFKNLGYFIDGANLKPGTGVEGNIIVKDMQTGREQKFAIIADVIEPIELRFDHPNFNMRCRKTDSRKFILISHSVKDLDWKLATKQPWLKIEPSSGTLAAGQNMFVTFTAAPPDKTAVTHDNGLVFSGAAGLINKKINSKTFVIPLLREKEGRKMPFGKIVKINDIGKAWKFFGTCLRGTKIETGQVKEIGRAHTKALMNPTQGPPAQRKEFLPIIGNERFSRAMWVYPHSEAVFNLEGSKILAFSAYVGISNDARQRLIRNQHRKINFEIWVDGKVVTQSGLMKTSDLARYLTVENLKGAKELKLITRLDSDKDDNTFLACWCDANFYLQPDERKIFTKEKQENEGKKEKKKKKRKKKDKDQ